MTVPDSVSSVRIAPEGVRTRHGIRRSARAISVWATRSDKNGACGPLQSMTDGTNTWNADSAMIGKSNYSAYGYFRNADGSDATASNSRFIPGRTNLTSGRDGRAAIDELLAKACTNAKSKKVIVYTVGFSVSTDPIDAQGLKILSDCATGPDYAFVANDPSGLIAASAKIAQGIGSLRITR